MVRRVRERVRAAFEGSKSADADEDKTADLRRSVRNGVFIRGHVGVVRNAELAAAAVSKPQSLRSAVPKAHVQAGPELAQEARTVHRGGVRSGRQPAHRSGLCGSERSVSLA